MKVNFGNGATMSGKVKSSDGTGERMQATKGGVGVGKADGNNPDKFRGDSNKMVYTHDRKSYQGK